MFSTRSGKKIKRAVSDTSSFHVEATTEEKNRLDKEFCTPPPLQDEDVDERANKRRRGHQSNEWPPFQITPMSLPLMQTQSLGMKNLDYPPPIIPSTQLCRAAQLQDFSSLLQNDLQQKIVQQQGTIQKLQRTVVFQQQLIEQKNVEEAQLKQKVEQLQKARQTQLQESLSEKLEKCAVAQKYQLVPLASSQSAATAMGVGAHYNQGVLLRKINYYLAAAKKAGISEKGYCHGIVLLWLTMMSWKVESLFYQMIRIIADCPVDQLSSIENTITLFLDLIEVGQYPAKYSNNTCSQENIDEIIGDVGKLFAVVKNFTQVEMAVTLRDLAEENNMISVVGWRRDEKTGKDEGHTVGLIYRDGRYHFFDPNFEKGESVNFKTYRQLLDQIWQRTFIKFGVNPGPSPKFSLNAVHRLSPLKPALLSRLTFFGDSKPQEPRPVASPVERVSAAFVV